MQAVVVLLVASLAVVAARSPPKFPKTPEYRACYEAMKAKVDKNEIKEIVTACVAEQTGVDAIIESLTRPSYHARIADVLMDKLPPPSPSRTPQP